MSVASCEMVTDSRSCFFQGGSLEAGKERRRQQDMESNYNLVWDDDKLQEVPREDDDADGEVEVESF